YVAEQGGVIRTFLSNDTSSTVFADLRDRVDTNGGEKGLLGMAFHPNFASNNYIYVYYSGNDNDSATDHSSYISRFTATSATVLNINSEYNIITIGQPYGNHNGGNILFGADGYLYIGMGDGGSGGDPQNYAQNINSLLGKMLRIDVNNTSTGKNYAIPGDNPYAGATAGADEIFALGLRNPWRWSFERGTNNLIAGDVGQDNWEEVDIITRGGNYGWRCYEGNHNATTSGCAAQSAYIAPIHEYDHNTGYSITGGYVYTGSIQSLAGHYIFSDYGPGPIWAISDPFGTPVVRELINDSTTSSTSISSFAEDAAGEIYVLRHSGTGYIYKITATTSTPNNNFPDTLSETGCVKTSDASQMNDGLIPYDINAPFWS
ncbi:MAG TPA: PQQ-dependent sugar dehydrogenase, partial [Gammaproteobacteria bacterium]|nr:PQQ-dependent sugar dehydrogenase [Gammaproteobacteria bacterium]